jgi:hypothetical protein
VSLYRVLEEPTDLRSPALIVSFQDWVDAGSAGSTAAERIAEGGTLVVEFDTDALFDYRAHRPTLDIVAGVPKRFEWPEVTITLRRLEERDVFVLKGSEPDRAWKAFGRAVTDFALAQGVVQHVSIGAIPAAVPHTAPTPVMMTGSDASLMTGDNIEGLLRVPAAAVSLVEWSMAAAGLPAVGFWAQVPHYASPYAAGSIALIRKVEAFLGVTIGAGELETEMATQMQVLEEAIAANPESSAYIERLQSLVGEQEVPPADRIGEEVERFLRARRRGDDGPNPFGPSER